MLLWLDVETTGLNPREDAILEVAAILTDDTPNLVEVARYERLVKRPAGRSLSEYHEAVQAMHGPGPSGAPGLWALCEDPPAIIRTTASGDPYQVEAFVGAVNHDLADWIRANGGEGAQLAGSTINFNRAFMKEHLDEADSLLHYRNVDVTTLNEIARRVWPELYASRPPQHRAHRAMSDILESMECLRHYMRHLSPVIR